MAPHANEDVLGVSEIAEDAALATISIARLMSRNKETEEDLFRACTDLGFFYLDCRDHPSGQLTSQIDSVAAAALEFYSLPQCIKNEWEVNKDHTAGEEIVLGYKPAGSQTGSVAGKKDGFEGFMIFEHALRNASRDRPIHGPKIFQDCRELVEASNAHLGDIGREIMDSLSRSLNLEGNKNLAAHHRKDQPSPTALGLLKYLPYSVESTKIGHIPHTDIGSLSMVFSDVGGLQVYHPKKKKWMYIEPRPGHAVCNIGDSAEFLSQNVLRSSLHRVVPHPQEKEKVKLTVVYLMRPDTESVFVDRNGKEWRSVDWHNMKYRLFSADLDSQASTNALTGRLGLDDLWDEKEA